eukprot:scaffold6122_cov184-Amphora_coffeaeformis.AAC.5
MWAFRRKRKPNVANESQTGRRGLAKAVVPLKWRGKWAGGWGEGKGARGNTATADGEKGRYRAKVITPWQPNR